MKKVVLLGAALSACGPYVQPEGEAPSAAEQPLEREAYVCGQPDPASLLVAEIESVKDGVARVVIDSPTVRMSRLSAGYFMLNSAGASSGMLEFGEFDVSRPTAIEINVGEIIRGQVNESVGSFTMDFWAHSLDEDASVTTDSPVQVWFVVDGSEVSVSEKYPSDVRDVADGAAAYVVKESSDVDYVPSPDGEAEEDGVKK